MATVGEVAVRYTANGAKEAVRADRKVRDSIQTTAKTAQSETGTINRWVERHKSAIQAIGVATAGVMGAILSTSPTLRTELAGVRMAFSLLADTIANDLLPGGGSLTELAFELVEAFRGLPGPVRAILGVLAILTPLVFLFGSAFVAAIAVLAGVAALVATVYGVFLLLKTAFNLISAAITEIVIPALQLLWGRLKQLPSVIGDVLGWIISNGPQLARRGFDLIIGAISTALWWIVDNVPGFIKDGIIGAKNWLLNDAPGAIKSGLGAVTGAVGDGLQWLVNNVPGFFKDAIKAGINWITEDAPALLSDAIDTMLDVASGIGEEMATLVTDSIKGLFNAVIPSEVSLDPVRLPTVTIDAGPLGSTTVGGQQIFGGVSFGLPQLRSGGFIERGGLARLHAGERVVPAAEVGRGRGGTGGGSTVIFEQGAVQVDGAGSPKRTAEKTVEELSGAIGTRLGSRGVGR